MKAKNDALEKRLEALERLLRAGPRRPGPRIGQTIELWISRNNGQLTTDTVTTYLHIKIY